ncbi:MAG: hypothetical protein Q3993_01980 [Filifactor alocis]|nr:hypothetical protein [Filifactor alocis]
MRGCLRQVLFGKETDSEERTFSSQELRTMRTKFYPIFVNED